MDEIVLTASTDRATGTRTSRRIRRDGWVPGVLYGLGAESVAVAVDWLDLRRALTTEAGVNAIIQLEVEGERHMSIIKDLQRHPVRRDVLHIDFLRIDPTRDVTVDVPIVMVGEARELIAADGMVDQNLFTLSVNAPPDRIPTELEVDISDLAVGDSVRVGDLALPVGVSTDVDPEDAVAVGTITRSTLEAIAAEEAAAAAAAEAALLGAEESVEGAEPSEDSAAAADPGQAAAGDSSDDG
jgi:large subunit ribosomal protein L25